MNKAVSDIVFTPKVRELQATHGSRAAYARLEVLGPAADRLGPEEVAFLRASDTMFLATVSETGWPYVQHRGGPPGFLRMLDASTIAFADFRGNRQYISAGNLAADDRVSLIVVDFAGGRRLKLWGRAHVVEAADDPALLQRLQAPGYGAEAERAIVVRLQALDWNCPQHIRRRYTREELTGSGPRSG